MRCLLNISGRTVIPIVKTAMILVSCASLIISCTSPTDLDEPTAAATDTVVGDASQTTESDPTAITDINDQYKVIRPYPSLPQGIERVEATQLPPTTGEVPSDLLEIILEELSHRLKIDLEEIDIIRSEAILWSDGSLGCRRPDEYYTQEPVSGYWLVLQVDDVQYDYRMSDTGNFFLCEQPLPNSLPVQLNK